MSECPRTNLAVPHPETVSVCLRGQASVCMGHHTRTPVAGHDMTNRISTPHNTQEHVRACLYLNKFRERERERSPLFVTRLAQPIRQYVLTVRKNSARDTAKHAHHQVYRRHVRMNMMASRSSFENIIFRGMALSRTFLFVLRPIGVFSETVILFDQSHISHY